MSGPQRKRSRPLPPPPPVITTGVRRRIAMVSVVLVVSLIGIGYRAFSMQVQDNARYRALANKQHLRSIEVPAPRGAIYDRRGVELAATANASSVWANPREVLDRSGTAASLAPILDPKDDNSTLDRLASRLASERYFVWLARHVTDAEAAKIRALELPGVRITAEPRRFYPSQRLAGPVLGFADIDGRGLDGIELSMNDLLTGTRGHVRGIRDASGNLMLPDPEATARPGSSLHLTLDRTVQFIAEKALGDAVDTNQAVAGCAIVLDVASGAVLAMANVPTTDPNRPGPNPVNARNRIITDAYEIGSIMKLFSIGAALEAGVVAPETTFQVFGGRMRLAGKVIRDSFRDDELTVAGIIKRSSNVGAIQVARLLGREKLHDALRRYRFGQRTGIELHGERAGMIRSASRWRSTDLAVISYGYGMTVTPLQALAAVAAIGSGGVYHAPRLVNEVRDADGSVSFRREPTGERIMSSQTAADLLAMMKTVFDKGRDGGTARSIDLDGFTAAAKTGTARKIDPATGAYGKLYLSSFAGVAPADNPRIAVLVLIDEPSNGEYYGSTVAGPAFGSIVSKTLKVLGVAPDAPAAAPPADPAEIVVAAAAPIAVPAQRDAQPGDVVVPDFEGLGIAGALTRAREAGVEIEIRGSGRARRQSIGPGPAPPDSVPRVHFAH